MHIVSVSDFSSYLIGIVFASPCAGNNMPCWVALMHSTLSIFQKAGSILMAPLLHKQFGRCVVQVIALSFLLVIGLMIATFFFVLKVGAVRFNE
jgi:hypothetical protein